MSLSAHRPGAAPWPALLLVLAALAAAPVAAQDRASVEPTTITGHKELPKVLYIVPWKKPVPGALAARPRTSLLDEALAPVDRQEFRRQIDYRAQLSAPVPPSPAPQEKTQ
jgi:hypothetical protein